MTSRTTKRSLPPPTRSPRQTRRGIASEPPPDEPEPYFSIRPTRREVVPPQLASRKKPATTNLRGQFSIAAARGVAANVVAGEIADPARGRSTTRSPPIERVRLVTSSKRAITLEIDGREVTLERRTAIELASMIFTSFGASTS